MLNVDETGGSTGAAEIADERFGLLVEPFERGRGGAAERDCVDRLERESKQARREEKKKGGEKEREKWKKSWKDKNKKRN